ncbi:TPA: glycosyltransferase family 4 protein [Proteus mirabilis]
MKLLFCHDHYFYTYKKNLYSPGKFTNSSFERYFPFFKEITILSREKKYTNNSFFNKIDDQRISFIPFDNLSTLRNRFFLRKKYKKKITNIINNYDGIIVRLPSEIGFLVAECCSIIKKPYLVEAVACPVDAMKSLKSLKSICYTPIIKKQMERSILNASTVIYVTNHFLQNRYPTKGFKISASNIELNNVVSEYKSIGLKHKKELNLTLIGNLDSHHKGYSILYKALYLLGKENTEYYFNVYLIGAGEYYKKNNLSNHSNINIIFTGALPKDKVINILKITDIYLQPSSQEGLPRATIEAMSQAIPCIVSSAGGLPELIDKNFVHDKNDYTKLKSLIVTLINDNEQYIKQSKINLYNSKFYKKQIVTEKRNNAFKYYINELLRKK